jgi:hypothetical protein
MPIPERRHLTAGHRMTNQHRRGDFQMIQHRQNVICQSLLIITTLWLAGRTITAPRDAVDVTTLG